METIIRRLEQVAMAIAGTCAAAIMLIISYDAFARYVFHAPLPWAFEVVTYYLMSVAAYFALSATYRYGDHININLIYNLLPASLQVGVNVACSLMAAALFALIAYGGLGSMIEAYQRHEFLPGYIVWPAWLSHAPIPIGAALLVLRLVHHSMTMVRRGDDPFIEAEAQPIS